MYKEASYSLFKFAFTRHPILFCVIHGLVILFTVVLPFTDQFHWAVVPIMALVEVGYWIGTWKHRDHLRKINEKGPNNALNHHVELWDGADYVCMHGIKPSKRTRKCAWPIAHDLTKFPDEPSADERAIQYEL